MYSDSIKECFKSRGYCNYRSVHNPSLVSDYWDDLRNDQYVEGGYRQRRFGVVSYSDGEVQGFINEPHYQSTKNNKVFGGISRAFAPIEAAFILGEFAQNVVDECIHLIDQPGANWKIEMHQFRIKTPGNPTPEGVHHDGADFVLSMLINRKSVSGGKMMVYDDSETLLFEHTMVTPGECIFLNDRKVMHGVTSIKSTSIKNTGIKSTSTDISHRDVLVIAFFPPS